MTHHVLDLLEAAEPGAYVPIDSRTLMDAADNDLVEFCEKHGVQCIFPIGEYWATSTYRLRLISRIPPEVG